MNPYDNVRRHDGIVISVVSYDNYIVNRVRSTGYDMRFKTPYRVKCDDGCTRWVYAKAYDNPESLYVMYDGDEVFLGKKDLSSLRRAKNRFSKTSQKR